MNRTFHRLLVVLIVTVVGVGVVGRPRPAAGQNSSSYGSPSYSPPVNIPKEDQDCEDRCEDFLLFGDCDGRD